MAITGRLHIEHRARVALIGALALLVALIATAFAIGGSAGSGSGGSESAGATSGYAGVGLVPAAVPTAADNAPEQYQSAVTAPAGSLPAVAAAPALAGHRAASGGSGAATGSASGGTTSSATVNDASSVQATRIVKTGELTVRVAKGRVQTVAQSLATLAAAQGGYVSSSNTDLGSGTPSSAVVLRVPVDRFQDAITAAEKLGHFVSLTTSADDVTGKYVDLNAREHALQQTRSTYLSILSRARTIGATLSVQERIDEIQQQIDQLHGQIKLLGNQSSYSTLTVDVVPVGAAVVVHHQRHGIGKAWHDSWSRFGRGIDAMVGAIGPIVFAVLLLALIGGIGTLGYRGVRRVTS